MPRRRLHTRPPKTPKINLFTAWLVLDRRACKEVYKAFQVHRKNLMRMVAIHYMTGVLEKEWVGTSRASECLGDNLQNRKITKAAYGHLVGEKLIVDKQTMNGGRAVKLTGLGKTVVNFYISQINSQLKSGEDMLNIKPKYLYDGAEYDEKETALPDTELEFLIDFFNRTHTETQKEFLNQIIKTL